MPAGTRIRDNNVFGTTTDNPLTIGAAVMNSTELSLLSTVVAGDHAIITLDPLRVNGNPEIIVVTAHGVGATSASITRGAYGTVARAHPLGTQWVHAPVIEDVTKIVTSGTRPTDPYRGQKIFETDTNSYVGRDTSDAWQTIMPLGAWISWIPTLVGLSGGTLNFAKFTRHGRTIFYRFKYTLAGAGFGSNPSFTLPVATNSDYAGQDYPIGHAAFADFGTATYPGVAILASTTTAQFQVYNTASTYAVGNAPTATVPFTWAVNDYVMSWGAYEAAS